MKNNKMPDMKTWREERYKLFNEKINHFKNHSKYEWLRKYADDAIQCNEGSGYLLIKANDFIKRIENASLKYISDWLENKNQLEWSGINK